MNFLIKGASVYIGNSFTEADIFVKDGLIAAVSPFLSPEGEYTVFDFNNCSVFPGFTDVHVHFREPGFSYKETIKSGSLAAARGGYTHVCTMPNLNPVPDSIANLKTQTDIILHDSVIDTVPFAAITVGEKGEVLSDMDALADCTAGFSDDGRGVQSDEIMLAAMNKAKSLGKIISSHCERNDLVHGGCIHAGHFAKEHSLPGISSESEYKAIERDLALARESGCKYHVCHISTRQSAELIRNAKSAGIDVTCETAPHYLTLCEDDLKDDGRFKMNPPLRSRDDKDALIEALCDGTIDMIATDHAPHSEAEKSGGLLNSLMGITGLECAFPVMYTMLVKTNIISLEKLIQLMHDNPMKRFGPGNDIEVGAPADFTVFDLNKMITVNARDFLSMGKTTPFDGIELYSECKLTCYNGNLVYIK